MNKLFLPLLLLLVAASLGATSFTSRSLLFADSYMLRARGCDANYWNPALLSPKHGDLWLPAVNTGMQLGTNYLSLDLYNYVMEQDYLDDEAKQEILDAIDGSMDFSLGGQISLFGLTLGNLALTSSLHLGLRSALSEDILELVLYGNGDGSRVYELTDEENYLDALSYLDFTFGMGDIRLPLPYRIPDIDFGFAASFLAGAGKAFTQDVSGYLSANLDGLTIRQDALLRTGAGGVGVKGLLGLHSEPLRRLHAGLTLDNFPGYIKWGLIREDFRYHFEADSLYVSDLDEDLENLYTDEYTQTKGEPFSTTLPPELRFSLLYDMKQASLSLDLVKGFGESETVSRQLRYSVGAQLTPVPILPIQIGYGSGNGAYPWRMSYGLGINLKAVELGFGIQSIEAVLPGPSSKGIAFATYFNLRL